MHANFHVLTGGPGSGKTTVINALRHRGLETTVEAGRSVIANALAQGENPPWLDPLEFAEKMLAWDISEYQRVSNARTDVYFDRGIPDIVGYLTLLGRSVPAHIRDAAIDYRYNSTVFCFPPWPEIYRQDSERHQDFDEAERTWRVMVETYQGLGYQLIEVPKGSVEERVAFILSHGNE